MATSWNDKVDIMTKIATLLLLPALAAAPAWTQSPETPAPQTARQALLEMFSSKTPGTFVKHLPAATLSALEKSGALVALQQYSMLAGQLHTTGKQIETFETGSVLVAGEDAKSGQKLEIIVENDALQGEDDNIELSFQTYKDKQLQRTPFMPRITFAMKMESGVWKLNEILATVRVPIADPDFLKIITEGMKSRATALASRPSQNLASQGPTTTTILGADPSIVAAMRTIVTAEISYSSTYRSTGFTCTLSDLDGFGGGEPNEHQAMLIGSSLASGKKFGYVFTLSGCAGTPASSFHLAATPSGDSFGRRVFCSDQSEAIRYSADGNPNTCFAGGLPVH
jgi:hypothetical protein